MNTKRDPEAQSTWDWEWFRGLITAEEYAARWGCIPPECDVPMSELNQDAIARAKELMGR